MTGPQEFRSRFGQGLLVWISLFLKDGRKSIRTVIREEEIDFSRLAMDVVEIFDHAQDISEAIAAEIWR